MRKVLHSKVERSRIAARAQLRHCLESMQFSDFEKMMKQLLGSSGYISIYLAGRSHKRGRTARGGMDMTARSATDLASALTIVQIKQYKRVVSRRFVDELRGAMLRHNAEQGLLITMSKFSKVAHQAARESEVAPIRLMEGDEVLDLLFLHRIGVVESEGYWIVTRETIDKSLLSAMGTYRRDPIPVAKRHAEKTTTRYPSSSSDVSSTQKPKSNPHDYQPVPYPMSLLSGGEMTWSTHLMAGLNALWLLELFPGLAFENAGLLAGAAALGALLPDLDASESKIKHLSLAGIKPFFLPSQAIYNHYGHRSFLHSVAGLALVGIASAALSVVTGRGAALALCLGYASHLMADAMTKSGIPFLYPRRKRFHLLSKRLRVTTGSLAEEFIFVLLSITALALMLRHLSIGG